MAVTRAVLSSFAIALATLLTKEAVCELEMNEGKNEALSEEDLLLLCAFADSVVVASSPS